MILPSITYALFLISVIGIFWALESSRARLWLLLVASLVFYASLQVQYLLLMVALLLVTFFIGTALVAPMDWRTPNARWQVAEQGWNRRRRWLLGLGIGANVLLLLGFKYLEGIGRLLGWTGISLARLDDTFTGLVMPLGLSFFVFECIAYLVDVYRGSPAAVNIVDFGAYKLFFPKLISGPITRFHPFLEQVERPRDPGLNGVVEGLWLIAYGAVKKLLLADHIAILVNLSFDNLPRAGSADIALAVFAYGLQLYLDFSAYVNIARGSALLLGINLPENFDAPYFTTSLATFWRRWHMTLGDWLRNYLYFPLGGSRQGLGRTCVNLMIIMLIAGIWHGNNWGFVIWGGIHGAGLVIHRLMQSLGKAVPAMAAFWLSLPGTILGWMITQGLVFSSWLFFRLPDPQQFTLALQRLAGTTADPQFVQGVYLESLGFSYGQLWLLLGGLFGLMGIAYALRRGLKLELSWPVKLLLIPLFSLLAWLLAPAETLSYIYFDF
ncbi:membrane-bound O-acyltransferase family protein [Leptolyngbya sp. BL0902]|uniref:MBOAT family O-acyltransferase n=1 Tax=Leptolyngbya sp. BL0902 TaxID=1115757 RepID=UPI0018E74494|nr:MBOAT family protein [Leptolyngbya sp. BL0902]QQE67085.1 membrane-bound O-acyltransferase family protein [Leptolyngbya sp. BL0902]